MLNPSTQEVIAKVPNCQRGETAQAIAAADKAFPGWKGHTAKQRADILKKCVVKSRLLSPLLLLTASCISHDYFANSIAA